jgi:hypothetical protein
VPSSPDRKSRCAGVLNLNAGILDYGCLAPCRFLLPRILLPVSLLLLIGNQKHLRSRRLSAGQARSGDGPAGAPPAPDVHAQSAPAVPDPEETAVPVSVEGPAAPAARADAWRSFQVLKGIGIVEVLLHHLFGFSAREFTVAQTPQWWVLMVANRLLHFAVPTFLLVSALVLTRGIVLQPTTPDWKRFYSRRTLKTVWPYVLWSGLYVCFRLFILARPQDVHPTPVALPPALLGGGEIVLPALLATGESWQRIVLNGKAYFHLYFLAILTQFSLVFPLLFVALRRMRLPFAALLGLTALLQGGVYVLQAKLSALAVSRLLDDLVCGPPVHRHVAGHEPGGLAAHLGALALADRAGDVGGPGAVSVVVVVPAEHGQLRPGGRDRACGQQRNSRHGLQRGLIIYATGSVAATAGYLGAACHCSGARWQQRATGTSR